MQHKHGERFRATDPDGELIYDNYSYAGVLRVRTGERPFERAQLRFDHCSSAAPLRTSSPPLSIART